MAQQHLDIQRQCMDSLRRQAQLERQQMGKMELVLGELQMEAVRVGGRRIQLGKEPGQTAHQLGMERQSGLE